MAEPTYGELQQKIPEGWVERGTHTYEGNPFSSERGWYSTVKTFNVGRNPAPLQLVSVLNEGIPIKEVFVDGALAPDVAARVVLQTTLQRPREAAPPRRGLLWHLVNAIGDWYTRGA